MNGQKSAWGAIVYDDNWSGELDVTLHDTREEAEQAIVDHLHDLYGDQFSDDPPPNKFSETWLSSWIADNDIKFLWRVKEIA